MTDPTDPAPPSEAHDPWPATLEELRTQHPDQKDSVLFCVHKLQLDPAVGLRDLRDEAAQRGIPMAGRALHSAKVLLGLAEAKPRQPRQPQPAQPAGAPEQPGRGATAAAAVHRPARDAGIEDQVLSAVRQIQSAAGAEAERLRQAMRQAIAILQDALDD